MRCRAGVEYLAFEEMARVRLQFRARQDVGPSNRQIRKFVFRKTAQTGDFKRTALGKVSLEPGSINFDALNFSRRSEFNDYPVMTGTAPPLCFPTITHICSSTRHD